MDVCNALPGWPAKQETPVLDYIATTLYSNTLIDIHHTGIIACTQINLLMGKLHVIR